MASVRMHKALAERQPDTGALGLAVCSLDALGSDGDPSVCLVLPLPSAVLFVCHFCCALLHQSALAVPFSQMLCLLWPRRERVPLPCCYYTLPPFELASLLTTTAHLHYAQAARGTARMGMTLATRSLSARPLPARRSRGNKALKKKLRMERMGRTKRKCTAATTALQRATAAATGWHRTLQRKSPGCPAATAALAVTTKQRHLRAPLPR